MGVVCPRYEGTHEAKRVASDDRILSEYSIGQWPALKSICLEEMVGNICTRDGVVWPKPADWTEASATHDRSWA